MARGRAKRAGWRWVAAIPFPGALPIKGHYYFHFNPIFDDTLSPYHSYQAFEQEDLGSSLVEYSVIANAVAKVTSTQEIVATYQADLYGRILEYDNADSSPYLMLDEGPEHPFYYGPALYSGAHTYMAAISGAQSENDEEEGVQTTMFVLKDDAKILELNVEDLCTDFPDAAPYCPSAKARPLDSPLLLNNKPTAASGEQMEAWFLL